MPKSKASTGWLTDAAAPAPGKPSLVASRSELAKKNSKYGEAVTNTDKKVKDVATAKEAAKVPNKATADAHTATVKKEQDIKQNEVKQEEINKEITKDEASRDKAQSEADSQQQLIEDNNSKIEDLEKGSPDDQREATALKEQNKVAAEKRDKSLGVVDTKNKELTQDETDLKTAKKEEDDLDVELDAKKEQEKAAKKDSDAANKKVKDAKSNLADAKEDENNVMHEQAKEHPATFGKDVDAFDKAKTDAAAKKRKDAQDALKTANKKLLEAAKTEAKKDPDLTKEDKKQIDEAGSQIAITAIVTKRKAAKALAIHNKRIKKLKEEIESGKLTSKEANKDIQELEHLQNLQKKIEGDKNKTLNEILASQMGSALKGEDNDKSYLYFDAPAKRGLEGKLEDIIADKMQPMYKHAFIGEFPDKLKNLDWLVKGMDRPKVDIEYVEQVRANVKRQYPIKYNYGDLSLTFLDDVHHKTVMAIYEYFTNNVWSHKSIKSRGTLMLRDSTVIPELMIYDLTDTEDQHRKYTYQNVSLLSFDYDSYDDYEDGGVHSIQAVFKIEGFKLELAQSPRALNLANDPIWF